MRQGQQAIAEVVQASAHSEENQRKAQASLAHRFRHTLRSGQVSPLLHLILRYRQETQTCTPNT